MEEIDLEYSKIKLDFAKGLIDENSLIYGLPYDLIESISENLKKLYFEICLKIYNRLIGKLVRVTQGQFKNGGGKRKFKKKRRKSKRKSKKKKKSKTRRRRR